MLAVAVPHPAERCTSEAEVTPTSEMHPDGVTLEYLMERFAAALELTPSLFEAYPSDIGISMTGDDQHLEPSSASSTEADGAPPSISGQNRDIVSDVRV